MADVNPQGPSEDEDFDAVTDGQPVSVAVHDDNESEPKASPTTVKVISDIDTDTDTDTDTETEPELESESKPETEAPPETEEAAEPEVEVDEPAAEAEPAPEEHEQEPAAAVAPPKIAKSKKGNLGRTLLEVVLLLAVVGLGLWSWTLYSDNKDLKTQVASLNANPQVAVQKQTQALITQVGKLIDLPKDETPTIANVTDATAAKKQSAFFNSAQNGDKVLMYVKTGEAILYRPSTEKIILVAPLTFNNSAASTSSTPASTSSTKTSTGQ